MSRNLYASLVTLGSEQPALRPHIRPILAELNIEAKKLSDKEVIDAFLDKKAAFNDHLNTDGRVLDGLWMGGAGIATWGPRQITFQDLGSKGAQKVQNMIRKMAPKNWLDD